MTKLAFMFPGQGSLEEGMGREIAEAVPAAMAVYDEGSEAAGLDLKKLCFDTPLAQMVDTGLQQPALVRFAGQYDRSGRSAPGQSCLGVQNEAAHRRFQLRRVAGVTLGRENRPYFRFKEAGASRLRVSRQSNNWKQEPSHMIQARRYLSAAISNVTPKRGAAASVSAGRGGRSGMEHVVSHLGGDGAGGYA